MSNLNNISLQSQMPNTEGKRRIKALQSIMKRDDIDAMFIYADEYRPGNSIYLTNYKPANVVEEAHQAVFLPREGEPVVFMGTFNTFAANKIGWIKDNRPMNTLETNLPKFIEERDIKLKKLSLVGQNLLPVTIYESLKRAVGDVDFIDGTRVMFEIRQIKSEAEIKMMEKSAEINDLSLQKSIQSTKVGGTEIDIAAAAEYAARSKGSEIAAVFAIASGINSNYPAWRPTMRKIEDGDFIFIDCHTSYQHYCNDAGVTIIAGEGTDEQNKVLDFANNTVREMISSIKPGKPIKDLYNEVYTKVKKAGYSDNFLPYSSGTRAIGHGCGLDMVESPNLGPESDLVFSPNTVLAIKIDLHGFQFGGLRVEYTCLITESGARSLNKIIF